MTFLPADWKEVRLGDVGSLRGGTGFPLRFQGRKSGGVPFYKVSDMNLPGNEIRMHDSNNWISEGDSRVLGAAPFPKGSIVFAKVGAAVFLERKRILTRPSCIDNNMMAIIPDASWTDVKFLHFALQMVRFGDLVSATALPSINASGVAGISLAMPALKEQEAIAEALSDADAAIESLDALIAKKRDVKQGTMQQLLTGRTRLPGFNADWKEVRLGEIAEVDPENLSAATSPRYGFKYISLENVSKGRLVGFTTQVFHAAPSRARRILKDLDVLLATVRPNLLGHLLFRGDNNWIGSTGFAVVRCKSDFYSPTFMSQVVFSHVIQAQIELLITGSNYPAINSKDVRELRVPLPPLKEQEAIAEALSAMDDELEALTEQVSKVRMVKEGMMQDLLTGKVRLA